MNNSQNSGNDNQAALSSNKLFYNKHEKELLPIKEGCLFIISAPSGSGKTTLLKKILELFPSIQANISYTTRPPRGNEVDGEDYHFVSEQTFQEMIKKGDFLEYEEVFGNFYGTSLKWIEEKQKKGIHLILTIDTKGALAIKGKYPGALIFINAPSKVELKDRLEKRKSECDISIAKRLAWAEREIAVADQFDYLIINDCLPVSIEVLKSIIISEMHKKN